MKKFKELRTESVDEAKKLGSRVKITKGRFAGKEGIIRQMDNGKFKGADKSFDIDLDDGKEANGVRGKDIKIVKEALGSVDEASSKYLKYSDLLLKKARIVAQGPMVSSEQQRALTYINREIAREMKKLGITEEVELHYG